MRGRPIILTLYILVLSDVARHYKPIKSRNHTGILFISYTIETLQAYTILAWEGDNIVIFDYLLQLSIISLGQWENIYIQPEALKTSGHQLLPNLVHSY